MLVALVVPSAECFEDERDCAEAVFVLEGLAVLRVVVGEALVIVRRFMGSSRSDSSS
jgi:hypothetical protein